MWYAAFLILIVALMAGLLQLTQHLLSRDFYRNRLDMALEEACQIISLENGEISVETQTDTGVHITVLDETGALILGKRAFNVLPADGKMRLSENGSPNYAARYLLDKHIQLSDGRNVWLRAYISADYSKHIRKAVMGLMMIMIPLLLFIVIGGGYRMTRYAFRPIEDITRTVDNISNSIDLKQRTRIDGQTDEVGRLALTFDGMLERLERSMDSEKRFISDASHELRTPLSVICSQSEFALMPERTLEEKDAALQVILERGKRASDMLAQMLMLSRMDYDKLPISMERINLSELIESLAIEMQAGAGEKQISIICRVQKQIYVQCDELLIMRMLSNLVQNAIQYGQQGGHVWVDMLKRNNEIEISVRDDGIGISPEEQENIWLRFYQTDKSRMQGEGSGLGLPIVRWIVKAHGGRIALKSHLDEGSCFTVYIPAEDKKK